MNKMLFKPWKYSPQLSLLYKGLPNESSEELPSTSGQEKKQEHRWIAKYVALIMLAFLSLSFNLAAVILVAKAYRHGDEGHHLLKSPEIFSKGKKNPVCLVSRFSDPISSSKATGSVSTREFPKCDSQQGWKSVGQSSTRSVFEVSD